MSEANASLRVIAQECGLMKHLSLKRGRTSRPFSPVPADQQSSTSADEAAVAGADGSAEAHRAPLLTQRTFIMAVALFVLALVFLISLESRLGIPVAGVSGFAYFNDQAQSWLHGRWDVQLPASAQDIETIHGKQYSYYPPFPALLLLPFVALFGAAASDILLTTVLSAANMSLLYLLFEQARALGWNQRRWSEHALIAVFCFFGSITLFLSLGGTVWFTAHIVCMTCTLLALLLSLRGHYGWGAVLLGCAFFSRFPVALGYLFVLYLAWQDAGRQPLLGRFWASVRAFRPDWQAVPWRRLLPVAAVMTIVGALFAVHNAVVFSSPLDTGYSTLVQQRYHNVTDGVVSLRYVPGNLVTLFFTFPHTLFANFNDHQPQVDLINGGFGVSAFVTTPLFMLLFWRNQRFSPLRAVLWMVVVLDVLALLPFYNEGGYQFGIRYLYDVYPFAFLLLVLNEVRVDWRFVVLGLAGIVLNVLGAVEFWTFFSRL